MKNSAILRFAISAMASLALCAGSIHASELPPEKEPLKDEILGPAMQEVEEENGGSQIQSDEEDATIRKSEPNKKPARNGEEDEEAIETNAEDKKFKLGKYLQFGGT